MDILKDINIIKYINSKKEVIFTHDHYTLKKVKNIIEYNKYIKDVNKNNYNTINYYTYIKTMINQYTYINTVDQLKESTKNM